MLETDPTELAREIKAYLQENLLGFLSILKQMVAINSFTANPAGVNALGELTAEFFSTLGFAAETIQSTDPLYGKHLILTRHGRTHSSRPAPKIGLVSHLDTVFPEDEEFCNDFQWREEGDRIYGPGVIDIKGGTVMIYMVLSALQAIAPDIYDSVTWIVLLDASEETGGLDFGQLCVERLGPHALACLIFEPGRWTGSQAHIVVARKGMVVYRIEVEGKASHAGSAHDRGANAILQMADVIQRVCKMTDYEQNLTYNVGTVVGGTVINRVPHFAAASVEMRAFSIAAYEKGIAQILALNNLSTVGTANGDFHCLVKTMVLNKVLPWPRNKGTDDLFQIWHTAADKIGFEVKAEERAGLSDGNYFWDMLPTLDGLGPAGENAHCSERSDDGNKEQEFVYISSFIPKAQLNTMAILELIKNSTAVD